MKNKTIPIAAALILSLSCFPRSGQAGNVTLTTYYPSPTGNYTKLSVGSTYSTASITDATGMIVEGKISIGTPTLDKQLTVLGESALKGNIFVTGNYTATGTPAMTIRNDNADNGANTTLIGSASTSGALHLKSTSVAGAKGSIDFLVDNTAPTPAMYIAPTGNVGIGTNNPQYSLDVKGGQNAVWIGQDPAAGGRHMTIDNGGMIVDTTGCFGGGYDGLGQFEVNNDKDSGATRRILVLHGARSQTINALEYRNLADTVLASITGPGGAYFADNVGIGTDTPAARLDVNGSMDVSGDTSLGVSGGARTATVNGTLNITTNGTASLSTTTAPKDTDPSTATSTSSTTYLTINQPVYISSYRPSGVNNKYSLFLAGEILANGFYHSSDERLKTNILPITDALNKIKAINGVTYAFKSSPDTIRMGLIAQNVEKVVPQVVAADGQGMKSIEYGNLVGLLIEGIKDQQKQIDALKARLDKLEMK